jgi:hypothetical protein
MRLVKVLETPILNSASELRLVVVPWLLAAVIAERILVAAGTKSLRRQVGIPAATLDFLEMATLVK